MRNDDYMWAYDYQEDILFIANPRLRSKESIEIQDNFHIDVDKDMRLASIEIWQASKFFRNVGSGKVNSKKLLKSIDNVSIDFKNWRNYFILTLVMYQNDKQIREKLTVPAYEEMSPLIKELGK